MPRSNRNHSREPIRASLIGIDKIAEAEGRPFVEDRRLEKDTDKAGKVFVRNLTKQGNSHFGKGPKNYSRSDESIREDVCQALFESYSVDASSIDVDVKDHCVYLKGQVKDRQMKKMAEDAVEHIAGVFDVLNELTLTREESMEGRRLTDSERELVNRMS